MKAAKIANNRAEGMHRIRGVRLRTVRAQYMARDFVRMGLTEDGARRYLANVMQNVKLEEREKVFELAWRVFRDA